MMGRFRVICLIPRMRAIETGRPEPREFRPEIEFCMRSVQTSPTLDGPFAVQSLDLNIGDTKKRPANGLAIAERRDLTRPRLVIHAHYFPVPLTPESAVIFRCLVTV